MILRVLTLIAIAIGSPTIASSQLVEPHSSLETYLLDGDFLELEAALSTLNADARETRDYSKIRSIYKELFQSARRERADAARLWVEEMPDSSFAQSAMSWVHHGRAMYFRGGGQYRFVSDEGRQKFRDAHKLALISAHQALMVDPDFPPALDAMLTVMTYAGQLTQDDPFVERLFENAPDFASLGMALWSVSPKWGHHPSKSYRICSDLAPAFLGYSPDECFVAFVFVNDRDGADRRRAAQIMETLDREEFDWIRTELYFQEWAHKPEAEEELIRLYQAGKWRTQSLVQELRQIDTIRHRFDRPFFAADAMSEAFARSLSEFQSNPQDFSLARDLYTSAQVHGKAANAIIPDDEIAAAWSEMHEVNQYNGLFWEFSAQLARAHHGPYAFDSLSDFFSNAIYYGNHQSEFLSTAMRHFYETYKTARAAHENYPDIELEPEDLQADLLCKAVRASRLLEAKCRLSERGGCGVGGYAKIERNELRRLWPKVKVRKCPYGPLAELDTLMYTPVQIPSTFFESETDG